MLYPELHDALDKMADELERTAKWARRMLWVACGVLALALVVLGVRIAQMV